MTQLTLFPSASARRTDPASSHLAARAADRSGIASEQRTRCLWHVVRHPGRTSAEIANAVGLDRHQAARRLPELMDAGKVGWKVSTKWPPCGDIVVTNRVNHANNPAVHMKRCQLCGRICVTWWPAGEFAEKEKDD